MPWGPPVIAFYTLRAIKAGEELLLDYLPQFPDAKSMAKAARRLNGLVSLALPSFVLVAGRQPQASGLEDSGEHGSCLYYVRLVWHWPAGVLSLEESGSTPAFSKLMDDLLSTLAADCRCPAAAAPVASARS